MSKDPIDNLFNKLENQFDIEQPALNHTERFLKKLNNQNNTKQTKKAQKIKSKFWKPFASIAAAVLVIVTFVFNNNNNNQSDLASISPKMAQTQDFFVNTISNELSKLKQEKSPEAQAIIKDAMKQLQLLENKYEILKTDLSKSNQDARVIYAMISNFQNRINILKHTLEKINEIKTLKNQPHETNITI